MANASGFDVTALLAAQLADCETHWSLGTFGVLAEFARDSGEPVAVSNGGVLSALTDRGGIRLAVLPEMRLFASESITRENWSHRVALCLPENSCAMGGRSVLTELGSDIEALRWCDRAAILFDLGLGAMQVDACIRVADPDLVAQLRAHLGRPVFEPGQPAINLIVPASPHRVFISRLGRIEVFQPIPPPHGKSPDGPHTHVLPKLLRACRTQSATEPVPDGFVPCAHFYPAHPVKDAFGQARPFDTRRHEAFQSLLQRFGAPAAVALKQRIISAIERGGLPSDIVVPDDRFARTGIRVAIRQMQMSGEPSSGVAAWAEAHDNSHHENVHEAEADAENMHG